MNGLNEKRYTKKQAIVFLVMTLVLIAAAGNAWNLNVPYVFSSGQTISSSAMNANFDYVESRLGAYDQSTTYSGTVNSITSTAPQNLITHTFTAPQAGYVVMQGFAQAIEEYRAQTTCAQYAYIGISTSSTSVGSYAGYYYNSTSATGWTQHALNTQYVMGVCANCSYTIYLNAYEYKGTCTGNYYYIDTARITLMYFPTYLL